jgi:heme/copper-type cytochrome/quinol oxidase subunit 2
MPVVVNVVSEAEFATWLASKKPVADKAPVAAAAPAAVVAAVVNLPVKPSVMVTAAPSAAKAVVLARATP